MNFFSRLALAVKTFFYILSQGALPDSKAPEAKTTSPATPTARSTDYRSAIQLLGTLQRDGRLIDFIMEDLGGASDADIGVAARVIHQGCRKAISNLFTLEPIWPAPEGSSVTVEPGYDAELVELIGFAGSPPHQGTLNHQGWRIADLSFPTLTDSFSEQLVQRAEVEK
ncbi:MAG: DUF2760 domain-containing protein [Bradymonadia bacterium]